MKSQDVSSIVEAIHEVASSATPFGIDIGMLLATIAMAGATIVLVYWNRRTVKAALDQIEESEKIRQQDKGLALYPFRRDLLNKIDARDFETLKDSTLDVELLFPGSFELYEKYIGLRSDLEECQRKKALLESAVSTQIGGDENDLILAKLIKDAVTEEEAQSGAVKPFSGISWGFDNSETGEREVLNWDELDEQSQILAMECESAHMEFRASAKAEIENSIHERVGAGFRRG